MSKFDVILNRMPKSPPKWLIPAAIVGILVVIGGLLLESGIAICVGLGSLLGLVIYIWVGAAAARRRLMAALDKYETDHSG